MYSEVSTLPSEKHETMLTKLTKLESIIHDFTIRKTEMEMQMETHERPFSDDNTRPESVFTAELSTQSYWARCRVSETLASLSTRLCLLEGRTVSVQHVLVSCLGSTVLR